MNPLRVSLLLALNAAVTVAAEWNAELEAANDEVLLNNLRAEIFERSMEESGGGGGRGGGATEGLEEQNPDLIEGDIVPSPRSRNANSRRNIWRGRTVPYYIDPSVNRCRDCRSRITNAVNAMAAKINANGKCLTIRPTMRSDKNYIHVVYGKGCHSQVGCTYRGRQDLSLGNGCYHTGTIQHEFMHALGFWHEQSRSDRDRYVTILRQNIMAGQERNFDSYRTLNQGFPYDYGSVMHYGPYAFSKNGKPTILTKGGNYKIGQRDGVSRQDVQEIRKLYGCY